MSYKNRIFNGSYIQLFNSITGNSDINYMHNEYFRFKISFLYKRRVKYKVAVDELK